MQDSGSSANASTLMAWQRLGAHSSSRIVQLNHPARQHRACAAHRKHGKLIYVPELSQAPALHPAASSIRRILAGNERMTHLASTAVSVQPAQACLHAEHMAGSLLTILLRVQHDPDQDTRAAWAPSRSFHAPCVTSSY